MHLRMTNMKAKHMTLLNTASHPQVRLRSATNPQSLPHHRLSITAPLRACVHLLPHFVLRYRQMRPKVTRDAFLATHGGLSWELCAVLYHIAPMALYRLICAFGHQSLVPVLIRCGLPLPVYFLADEKHSRCLTDKVYLPTIVCGHVLWHLGYTKAASTAAFTQSYRAFQ
jgi:hypothetical protein